MLGAHGCKDEELISFINSIIKPDPNERLSAAQALQHPWIKNGPEQAPPYQLTEKDSGGEAGLRLLQKHPPHTSNPRPHPPLFLISRLLSSSPP